MADGKWVLDAMSIEAAHETGEINMNGSKEWERCEPEKADYFWVCEEWIYWVEDCGEDREQRAARTFPTLAAARAFARKKGVEVIETWA